MDFVDISEASRRVFDVCVVGSGASGTIAAVTLARRGLSVLVIEQGRPVRPGSHLDDHTDPDGWAFARDRGRWTQTGYPWSAQAVGGGTVFYAGVSFRYHQRDLTPHPNFLAEAAYPHWELSRDELDEHYAWVERELAIAGPSDEAVGDYSFPRYTRQSLPYTAPGRVLAEGARNSGLRPVPTPVAISAVADDFGPGCGQLTSCTDHACPVGAKADVASRLLGRCDNLSLLAETRVIRLHAARAGLASTVDVLHTATRTAATIRARRFVLAANAIQSAALLLRSASDLERSGMGNSSGLVGRYLGMKNSCYLRGSTRPRQDDYTPLRHRYSSVSILDWLYHESFEHGIGGLIYEANPWDGSFRRGAMPLQVECIVGDRPRYRNQVRLSDTRDNHGAPRIVIDYIPHRLDLARLRILGNRATEVLQQIGVPAVRRISSQFHLGSTHLHGTLRAGTDPKSSVTDRNGKLHDYENVWVADGSTFPFSGNLNPTLTIQANSRRVASAIV